MENKSSALNFNSIICPQCSSNDVKIISPTIAKCNFCGSIINYNTSLKDDDTKCFAVKRNLDQTGFLRECLYKIASDRDTPADVFARCKFDSPTLTFYQVIYAEGDGDYSYNARLGIDREEEYTEWNSVKKEYVKKHRTVTDWSPVSGTYHYSGYTFLIVNNGQSRELKIEDVVLDNAYEYSGDLDFETKDPTPIRQEEIDAALKDFSKDAYWCAERYAGSSADHIKDFAASGNIDIGKTERFVIPLFEMNYSFDEENYYFYSVAVKDSGIVGTVPNASFDNESYVRNKLNYKFTRPLVVNTAFILLGLLLLFAAPRGLFFAANGSETIFEIFCLCMFAFPIVYFFAYRRRKGKLYDELIENNSDLKFQALNNYIFEHGLNISGENENGPNDRAPLYSNSVQEKSVLENVTPNENNFDSMERNSPSLAFASNNADKCPQCGEIIDNEDYVFCQNCGYRFKKINASIIDENSKSRKEDVSFKKIDFNEIPSNLYILDSLAQCNFKNDVAFPYWVYRMDVMLVNDERYIKFNFFNRLWNGSSLNSVILVNQNGEREIKKVLKDDDSTDNLFFCTYKGDEDVTIDSINVNGETILNSGILCEYNEPDNSLYEAIKIKYGNITYMPIISSEYWGCCCGRIHGLNDEDCKCGKSLSLVKEMLSLDADQVYVDEYLKSKIDYDVNLSFDENIQEYINVFTKLRPGTSVELLKKSIDVFNELDIYNKLKEKKRT